MNHIRILIIFLSLFILTQNNLFGQVVNEQIAKSELQKRGIDEQRFREEMLKKGIDLDKVDPTKPEELAKIESTIKQVLDMLEKEAKETKKTSAPKIDLANKQKELNTKLEQKEATSEEIKNANDLNKAVEKGSTLNEVISEKVSEKLTENIPNATIYGQNFFRDNSLKLFRTTEDSKPTRSYVIGVGDVIAISIYGTSNFNSATEISKDGYIQPEGAPVGRYYVAGLTIGDAEKLLKSGLSRFIRFRDDEFKIAIATARTINVNIFGEVFNNGSFNISAVNTAFNALVAAGGPTDKGSVRRIKLLRAGAKPRTIDVYKFINDASVANDFFLQENDYIQVPLADKLVTIYGAINRPYRYELLDQENLKDLVSLAGGLLPTAFPDQLQVTRMVDGLPKIIDVNLSELKRTSQDFTLLNGDIIKVMTSTMTVRNIVSIDGAIYNGGDIAFTEGMKISDLVSKSRLKEDAITKTAYLKRLNVDLVTVKYVLVNLDEITTNPNSKANILLQKGDQLTIRRLGDFAQPKTVSIQGAVRQPKEIDLDENTTVKVSDALFLTGGLKDNAAAFAYIFRNVEGNSKAKEYIYVNVGALLNNPQSNDNLLLKPNDTLVFYEADRFIDEAFVSIEGAVRDPKKTVFHPSLNLKDLILLAGGLQASASTSNIEVYSIKYENDKKTIVLNQKIDLGSETDLEKAASITFLPNDLIVVRKAPEYEALRTLNIEGEVTYPGTYALTKENLRISDLLKLAGGVTAEAYVKGAVLIRSVESIGYIIFDLQQAVNAPKSSQDLILQRGDIIRIPKLSNIVSLTGATNYRNAFENLSQTGKISFAYEAGKSAKYYVDKYAGGFDVNADKNRVVVERKNGQIDKVSRFLFFRRYPKVSEGALISIPYKIEKPITERQKDKEVDWSDVLKNSITQATSILSLVLLLRAIN